MLTLGPYDHHLVTARPPISASAPIRRRRRGAVLVAVLLSLSAGGATAPSAPVAAEVARVAQDPAETVTSTTVTSVPEDTPANPEAPLNNADEVAEENRRIWLVVGGLVIVAIGLLLVTIRYWRQTKPVAAQVEPEPPAEMIDDDPTSERDRTPGRRSRRSVAGADHATADSGWKPRGTGEHERIEPVVANQRARINTDQRRAAYEAARRLEGQPGRRQPHAADRPSSP